VKGATQPAEATPWRSLREPSVRIISWTIGLSALVHVALTPFAGLLGLMAWLLTPPAEAELESEQLRSIPITLIEDDGLADTPAAPAPPPSSTASELGPAPESAAPAPKAAPAPVPPQPVPAAKPEPRAPEPPPKAPPTRGKDSQGIGHPVAMSGVASEVVDSNANVNLLLLTERIREHPLGPRIGKLIVNFPQWSSFFESGEVDPVRDINRILVVGPQFRRSADVVAILQHELPPAVIRGAVDRLVQRPPKGRWLKSKLPVARAFADRAERLFALTAPNLLVVAPPHLEQALLAAPPARFPEPEGDAALVLHVKTPWRALIGLPFRLPESIAWLRCEVVPNADGSVQLRVSAEDADAGQAAEHARSLSDALNALTNPDLGALGALVGLRSIAFIDKIQFRARDKRISGEVRISPRQLERLLIYGEELVQSWTGRRFQGAQQPQRPGAPGASEAPGNTGTPTNRPAPALPNRSTSGAGTAP
jgi:hypothetical protein